MSQERIGTFGTFSGGDLDCSLSRYESDAPALAPPAACIPIPPDYSLFSQMNIRMDPACMGWADGRLSEQSMSGGWSRFQQDRPFDAPAVLLAADLMPPAVLSSQGMVAWVPTLQFPVSIRNIPTSLWLKGFFRTHHITCGLLEEDGELWDENDNLVAIPRQIAQFRTV